MRRLVILLNLVFLLIGSNSVYAAALLPRPPIDRDLNLQTEQYFKSIADNLNILVVTETAPNGNRRGTKGEIILYDNTGTLELWGNYDGGTTWQQLSP